MLNKWLICNVKKHVNQILKRPTKPENKKIKKLANTQQNAANRLNNKL